MGRLKHVKMNLFDAPEGSLLVHAVNGKGVWGKGIAKEFKERFPKAYELYQLHCENYEEPLEYPAVVSPYENGYKIGSLLTSLNYGKQVSPKWEILKNTNKALEDLFTMFELPKEIYSNKFNSEAFGVPWEESLEILLPFIEKCDILWTVCSNE